MKRKIFMGGFHLESNTSNPVPVTTDDFYLLRGEETLAHFPLAVQTVRDAGVDILPGVYAETYCVAAGVLTLESYRSFVEKILADIPLDGSIDGVWLYLHGSMQVEFIGSGEAFLVSAIRERIGPSVPIAVAMDFHGNISHTLIRSANIICGYRTAPHVDIPETQALAAQLLLRAIAEQKLPWLSCVRVPMLQPGEAATTDMPHIRHITRRLEELEQLDGIWRASYFTGMSWIDCPHNGSTVVVCGTAEDRTAAQSLMCRTAQEIWDSRYEFRLSSDAVEPEEAMERALSSTAHTVFISDSGDNVTAGATGDNAWLLEKLLVRGAKKTLVAGLWDEEAVKVCAEAGAGAQLHGLRLGGRHDPASTCVCMDAQVLLLHQGETGAADGAVLRIDGVDVIVNSIRCSFTGKEDFEAYGLNYLDYHVIAVKLGYLYPGLAAIKDEGYIALTRGSAMLTIGRFCYHNQRRPMFPFEDHFRYEPEKTLW